ncbi:hypothetical protein F442_13431 [Phytophthora nicotianae P10297]|uniref:Uncharacterized protein n=2 Tax=Phytophthora nicotianae TaxID=4792 RepID=W2YWI7_PHYNI|nr:hypothetical protein F444_13624 [Phytophthora nicotianae P1976]ETP39086.1 hypothetical protein F442_13431 [Phytophthora nicotianae P10297]
MPRARRPRDEGGLALLRDVLSDEHTDEDDLDEFWEHKYEHI